MPITITDVKGVGGSPPAQLIVSGTYQGCDHIQVTSSCSDPKKPPTLTLSGGIWTATFSNDLECACGAQVTITATCIVDRTPRETASDAFPIDCGGCPTVQVTQQVDNSHCINGERTVTLSGTVQVPSGTPVSVIEIFDATTLPGSPVPGIASITTPPAPFTRSFRLRAGASYNLELRSVYPQNCPPYPIAVTLLPCPPCCPTLALDQPIPTGCGAPASGSNPARSATVSFKANYDRQQCDPSVAPSSYEWVVQTPPDPATQAPGPSFMAAPAADSINSSTVAWTLVGGPSGSPAKPLDLSRPGPYSVSVTMHGLTGRDTDCNAPHTATQPFTVKSCCPELIRIDKTRIAGCEWLFIAQIDDPARPATASYIWSFGDNSSPDTTSGREARHTFTTATPCTVTVTMQSNGCPDRVATVVVDVPCSLDSTPPAVTGCTVTAGASGSGSIIVTFNENLAPTTATVASNYAVRIGTALQTPASVSYDAATRSATLSGLTVQPGDTTVVTVTGVRDLAGNLIVANGRSNVTTCSAPNPPNPPPPNTATPMIPGCWLLLLLSLVFSAAAVVLASIAFCIWSKLWSLVPVPPPSPLVWWLIGIAIALFVLSIIFLLLWYFICVGGTSCEALNAGRHFVMGIVIATPIIGLIAAVLGGVLSRFLCGVFIGVFSAILCGYWGIIVVILDSIAVRLGCLTENK
ncbi:MAG TPA: PKD domain-containing protein [Beijerinckiaceae bacterium]